MNLRAKLEWFCRVAVYLTRKKVFVSGSEGEFFVHPERIALAAESCTPVKAKHGKKYSHIHHDDGSVTIKCYSMKI